MSAKSRDVTEADFANKPAEFATPSLLARMSLEHDRVLSYYESKIAAALIN